MHNDNGPAFISYYDNGHIFYQAYYINGIHHRDDGPAFTSYNKDGSLRCEHYYLNDERLSKEEWCKKLSDK
jgi:antitoxin component YwqK of YwqJK toxin-antitoxin module